MGWYKSEKLKMVLFGMASLFGYKAASELPVDAENQKLDLTEDQIKKLEGHFGADYAKKMIDAVNGEIKAYAKNDLDIKAIKDSIDAMVKEDEQLQQELENMDPSASADDIKAKMDAISANQKKISAENAKMREELSRLIDAPVGDQPEAIINNSRVMKMEHSATHIFGSNQSWDAFDARPWNQRLRDGGIKATDFNTDGTIPLLQKDVEHFVRQNPTAIQSLFNDLQGLPAEWSRRKGVIDRIADAMIIPAEVVQGRAGGWSPKGKFKIQPEEGRVFAKKIDLTFVGYQLQKIENTWMHTWNQDGSHPHKKSFVYFLLAELVKQQVLDDRRAQINGIYVKTPDGDNMPGAAVNSQDGLRYLFYHYRDVVKKYSAADIGVPTAANIVDYVRALIMTLPEEDRNAEGLEFGLSQAWLDAYRLKAGPLYQVHLSTDEGRTRYEKNHPIDYPNIKFQPLKDWTKTDFMYITRSKNIEILEYDASEKGKFTFDFSKRDMHIFADYKLGIRLMFVGMKREPGEPAEFDRQVVWSNSVPVFGSDVKIPVFDNGSSVLEFHYPNMKIDAGFNRNITNIENAPKGSIIRITGNTELSAARVIPDGTVFDLAGNADFNLQSGGTLTLYVKSDGTFKEIKRTSGPEVAESTDVLFDAVAIDADQGTVFRKDGNTNRTVSSILNGVEGKVIRIYANTASVTTVSSVAGVISVASTATLDASGDFIELMKIDGVWTETNRQIA